MPLLADSLLWPSLAACKREQWLERAAIREYDGGQSRAAAERGASFETYGNIYQRPSDDRGWKAR